MFGNKMPYSNMQQLNLDWLLSMLKKILAFMPIDKGAIGDVLQRKASGAAWEPLSALTLDIHGLNTADAVAEDDEIAIYDKTEGGNRKATISDVMGLAPVVSVNGRTGAVAVYSRTLLWTNPDPTTLAAGTANVNMDGYDNIEIECTRTGDSSETYFVRSGIGTSSSAVTVDLTTIRLDTTKSTFNALVVMTRTADVYSTGIVFSSGQMIFDGTYYKDWDNRAVPYRIWGIKY